MSGACTLVIETSTPHASIALVGVDGVVEQRVFSSDRSHNALLFEPLHELLHGSGARKIGLVLVGSGPGSYSGTRVGIAAAQGVAIAFACPAVAVPSILAVPSTDGGAACLAIGDARRGSYWTASMRNHQIIEEPILCDAGGLEAIVAGSIAAGCGIFTFEDTSRFPLTDASLVRVKTEFPDAARLWKGWCGTEKPTRDRWSLGIPQPLYLKPPHITPGKRGPMVRN